MSGLGQDGQQKEITFELTAQGGDGPNIPCIPAILLAQHLAHGTLDARGAMPSMGLLSLEDYLQALAPLNIRWQCFGAPVPSMVDVTL